jgi:hypothetical protein
MRKNQRRARRMERIGHRPVVHVRQVDKHAEAIHLEDDLLAKVRETTVRGVGGRSRPIQAAPVRERHIPHAEAGEHPQRAERILDGVAAFDPDQAGDLAGGKVALDLGGRVCHRHAASVLAAQAVHEIDLLERVNRRVRPGIHRRHRDIGGPELCAYRAAAQSRDVGHQSGLADREIDRVETAPFADRVRDVVVAVDEGNRLENANGLSAVVLGG